MRGLRKTTIAAVDTGRDSLAAPSWPFMPLQTAGMLLGMAFGQIALWLPAS